MGRVYEVDLYLWHLQHDRVHLLFKLLLLLNLNGEVVCRGGIARGGGGGSGATEAQTHTQQKEREKNTNDLNECNVTWRPWQQLVFCEVLLTKLDWHEDILKVFKLKLRCFVKCGKQLQHACLVSTLEQIQTTFYRPENILCMCPSAKVLWC